MKPWVYVLLGVPVLACAGLFVCGLISFTPLGSLFGDRWHYSGGMGFGRVAPLPNQAAILYSSSQTGTSHIYSIAWNGHTSQQLTHGPQEDSDVAVSPNGKQIVFVRQAGDSTHLWMMNVNGTGQRQFTSGPDSQTQPCFSPNGKQIAYVNSTQYGVWHIWLANVNGRGARQLTNSVFNDSDTTPTFDKTGVTIYYSHYSNTVGRLQIYAVNTSGDLPRLLGFGTRPTVSPNGSQIAFYDQPQNQTLGIMNANGTGRRTVGTDIADGMNLVFCADGRMLTYRASSQQGVNDFVALSPTDGSAQTVATTKPGS